MSNVPGSDAAFAECESPGPALPGPPETPNTNRPNPLFKKQDDRMTPAESPGLTLNDEMVLKYVDGLVEDQLKDSKLKRMVENIVESGIVDKWDQLVQNRMEAVVNQRVSAQDIDAMLVASVATRDMVRNVGLVSMDQLESLVHARLAEREADLEHRLSTMMRSQPLATSRPPTSPRPFSSSQQGLSSPQTKAAWSSGSLYSVNAVPNHDPARALTHADLERDLTEKVLATQPDRTALGFNEIIMRDIANSVVRELVGIFESLLDRLLIEKKHDTLRTMVAELVTEDTLKLIATSRDQLKQREMGHITRELERLGGEFRERQIDWEERFQITQELRDSQDDLYINMDERCKSLEKRVSMIEENFAQRTEMDALSQAKSDEVESLRQLTHSHRSETEAVVSQLADEKRYAAENYTHLSMFQSVQNELRMAIDGCTQQLQDSVAELRSKFTPKDDLKATRTVIEGRLSSIDSALFTAKSDIVRVETVMTKNQRNNDETFCTKLVHENGLSNLVKDIKAANDKVAAMFGEVEDTKATKKDVEDLRSFFRANTTETRDILTKTSAGLDSTTGVLMALEQRVTSSYATKRYVDDTTKNLVDEVVERSDSKEELGRLWKEFAAEREDLRQAVRQQQHARKDLNEVIDDIQELRTGTVDLRKRCDGLGDTLSQVDSREMSHWENGQELWRKQKQSHDELMFCHRSLRDEVTSNSEFQKAEADRLRQQSTMRYLEQMSEALKLNESVEEIKQNKVKLPPVHCNLATGIPHQV